MEMKTTTRRMHDGGETHCPRDVTPPPVDWDHAYGDAPLREEACELVAGGMTCREAARELVLRYGRQCACDASELREAIEVAVDA